MVVKNRVGVFIFQNIKNSMMDIDFIMYLQVWDFVFVV